MASEVRGSGGLSLCLNNCVLKSVLYFFLFAKSRLCVWDNCFLFCTQYILSEREAKLKTDIWMRINAEYLEEQKVKEARRKEEQKDKPEKKVCCVWTCFSGRVSQDACRRLMSALPEC